MLHRRIGQHRHSGARTESFHEQTRRLLPAPGTGDGLGIGHPVAEALVVVGSHNYEIDARWNGAHRILAAALVPAEAPQQVVYNLSLGGIGDHHHGAGQVLKSQDAEEYGDRHLVWLDEGV